MQNAYNLDGSRLTSVNTGQGVDRFESLRHFEYTASHIRKLLQQLFPHRKLVLSQFTFFCHSGVSAPSGAQVRRGRRCFTLEDVLPMAALLGVKEEGIPYKNAEGLPLLVRQNAEQIFRAGNGTLISGYGKEISLRFPGESWHGSAIEAFLNHEISSTGEQMLFWSYDVGDLARQLLLVAGEESRMLRAA
jgi:hypothetical protein